VVAPAQVQQPAPAPAQAPAKTGLDALGDDKLLNELASRGLTNLLDRAFDVNNVPPAQRDAMRAVLALKTLSDPNAKLPAPQRRQLIQKVVAGVEAALPVMNDPKTLSEQAGALIDEAIKPDVNTLEYWGENARTQAAVRPVIEAALKLLDKAAQLAQQQADAMANQIMGPADPRAAQWEQLSTNALVARYTRAMTAYYLALSLDRASPQRKDVAAKAVEQLQQFDNPDSNVQTAVRIALAKLHMTRGEFDAAKQIFASVAKPDPAIQPAPQPWEQWEARYFAALSDLEAGNADAAQKALDELLPWQQQALPKDKPSQDRASSATAMLQYRIFSQRADSAKDDTAKKAANDKAVAVLLDLVKKRPGLQSIIFDQLMPKLPPSVDMKTLDPLLLQGFIARADEERLRPENERVDANVLRQGLAAADEMLRRGAAIDPQLADAAGVLRGFFLERLGQHAAAAEAFCDYLKNATTAGERQQIALDNALAIIGKLRSNPATADLPDTIHAYERFLPIAIGPPFNRVEFAYEYARRLQLANQPGKAVEYFRKVPQDDKRYASARFFLMAGLQQRIDQEKLSDAERAALDNEINALMNEVLQRVQAGLNAATTDAERLDYRRMLARTLLIAADRARRDQNDPKRALELLKNFEAYAAGLPNEKDLTGRALHTRVQAYMAVGDSNAATQTLVALLKSRPGDEGANVVRKLLQQLNADLDLAKAKNDRQRMQVLAQNRAQLSGFLVEWARNNADANIRKFTYRYTVFDAATKHLAAQLLDDPARRRAALEAAMKLYQQLESPESVALYKATLDPKSPEANSPDPAVSLGIGVIAYDLGDYATAQQRLGRLLVDRKLGTPTIAVEGDDGQPRVVENDQYWQATVMLMRSNIALAAANPGDAAAQQAKEQTTNYLKELYVRYGRNVGGAKWAPEFEQLRKQLAPDLNPDEFTVQATPAATQPASTQPSASATGG
jgi:hypothetical protein